MSCWAALGVAAASLAFSTLPAARPQCVRHLGAPAAPVAMAAVGGDADEGGETYEVTLAKPLGMQLAEQEAGVVVSMVYETGNAADGGVRVGDVVLATSASVGPQMWEKRTLAGVESAIRTRVDGQVRLRLRRPADKRELAWDAPLQCTYEVELSRPLGLVLRQRASGEGGGAAGPTSAPAVEVAEVVAGSSAAADGRIRPGDLVVATSASVGEQMWQKSSLEGVTAAISTRLALSPSVRLQLQRTELLGPWAAEVHEVHAGQRRQLSRDALRSLRRQRRELRSARVARAGADGLEAQVHAAVRRLAAEPLHAARAADADADAAADADGARRAREARQLARLAARLRSAGVRLDCELCTLMMGAALRAGQPRLALAAAEQLGTDGVKPDVQVYTTLVKAHAACGQRAEALAVLPRMSAEQVAPSVKTYNTLMSVCARAADRRGMLAHFAMLQQAGLRPTAASFNVLLGYCAREGDAAQATALLERMRGAGVPPDVISYSCAMQAHVARADVAAACALLRPLRDDGLAPDVRMLNTLLGGHAQLKQWAPAFALLRSFEEEDGVRPDALSYSLLLRACVRAKAADQAESALRLMHRAGVAPTVRSYAMVMSARAQPGGLAAVLRLLREMQAAGLAPDRYAFSALMEACVLNGRPETALAVYDQMLEQGVPADGVTRTLRLRALCAPPASAGALRAAFAGLEEMRADETGACEPNAVAYNAVLEGCVQAGDAERALAALRMLLDGRCSPNRATQGLIARFGVVPPGAPRRGERGKPTPRPRAATRRFLLEVLDLFEARGRRLNGDVYLALLRACEAEPEAAARVVSRRRAFDLRRAQLAEADELEEHLARTPVQPKK